MERRVGLRARTDFRVIARQGHSRSRCRGVEVSATGIVVDRGTLDSSLGSRLLVELELLLPERIRSLQALARPIWSFGTHHAFRFVRISDVDRLTLAEHLDVLWLRGVSLD
jgi:hypothetical protein